MADPQLAPLDRAARALGDRWSLLLVAALLDGPQRYGELTDRVGGIAPNVLSARLRRLEAEGVVVSSPYSQRPPRFQYELTAAGLELAGALRLLADWGARQGDPAAAPDDGPPRHARCDTPLEVRWWCPTCEEPVAAPDDERVVV
jgi:DNA-binding HxlR family transcriptional regulator